jgi:hypothetical protein
MIVVSNTTPLIGLASIERFDLLHHLFGEIYIAQAVYDEAVMAGRIAKASALARESRQPYWKMLGNNGVSCGFTPDETETKIHMPPWESIKCHSRHPARLMPAKRSWLR